MSIYIHIPFCSSICSYCDFAKVYYNEELVDQYLNELKKEVKNYYNGEIISAIYIGGGTPSVLTVEQLKKLFNIIKIFKFNIECEFTIECNINDIIIEKLKLFKENGVNRLSIGVQSFNKKNLLFLNRQHNKKDIIKGINDAKKLGFNNISIDLIYGLPNQTLTMLKKDLDLFLALDINHIACYSLIVEKHTKIYNDNIINIDENKEYEMYQHICGTLTKNGFIQYEVSNFAKDSYQSKHNLVYWNNEHYYGFGAGASGYIKNIRYDNTRSITNYLKGNYRLNEVELTKERMIENELILGLRKREGINLNNFYLKYGIKLEKMDNIKDLIKKGQLVKKSDKIYINEKYIYLSNEILVNFIK